MDTLMKTETRNAETMAIDCVSTVEALAMMNHADASVPQLIKEVIPQISLVVDQVVQSFQKGGRLIYIGAGTSGRLGILDAVECVPTFGTDPEMVRGVIAGGKKAITDAVEGAEDNVDLGKEDLIKLKLSSHDIVIGLAASGKTPYVIGGLEYAADIGATTASICCNKAALVSRYAKFPIEVEVGPEVLTGSTRLKAGTAQKLVLNMISTVAMIKMGKAYQNLMVDVKPTNQKLVERSIRIIMEATDCSQALAEQMFEQSERRPKVAIVMILTNSTLQEAEATLTKNKGFIRKSISKEQL